MVTTMIALGPEFDFLPDDDEESLLGSSIHQDVIVTSYGSLKRQKRRQGLPWFVGNQLMMTIPRHDGGVYQPSPDILVHATLGDAPQTSLDVARVGPPALVIEVASPSTARRHDLDTLSPRAKPQVYALCGIAEYLVFDPLGEILPERVRAWHLDQRGGAPRPRYLPWLPDAHGRWVSAALGIAIAPQGLLLRFYDGDGRLIPANEELDDIAESQSRLLAAQERELAALRDEIRRLRGA